MWIRAAFWIGSVKQGCESHFRRLIDEQMIPSLKQLPGVANAKALWPAEMEDSPPQVACQLLVEFRDRTALEQMLASAERRSLRARVGELVALFDGHLSHVNFEVG